MGSQTLEILRQGVWASLTGGWFYDPHQGVFCNAVHLYLWLFLLCTPFVAYLYFPVTWLTWCIYCSLTSMIILLVKLANMALHQIYDRAQTNMTEANLKHQFFKITKETEVRDDDTGIELKVMGAGSRNSVERAINEASEENSMLSMENINSILDLKVDVHRKNSSESIEFMLYADSMLSTNSQHDQQSLAGSASVSKSIRSNQAANAAGTATVAADGSIRYLTIYPEHESAMLQTHGIGGAATATTSSLQSPWCATTSGSTAMRQPHLMRKSSEEFKRRHQRRRLERQNSLDATAETTNILLKLSNQFDSIAIVPANNTPATGASTGTALAARNETFLHPQMQHQRNASMAGAFFAPSTKVTPSLNGAANHTSNVTATDTTAQQRLNTMTSGNTLTTRCTRLQRHRSSETHDERLKQQNRALFLPIHHEHHHHYHQPHQQQHHHHHHHHGASSSGALAAIGGSILDGDDLDLDLGGSASGVPGQRDHRVRALQTWILGSSSDVFIEDDSYTKSDFSIEQLDGRGSSSGGRAALLLQQQKQLSMHYAPQSHYRTEGKHFHHHLGRANMRKDSNSTMSALQLPVETRSGSVGCSAAGAASGGGAGSCAGGMKRRRHSNATALFKSGNATTPLSSSQQPTVRRIKSAALEIGCPRPSVSNLSAHPNSVEAISGQQQIKNPQSALLPPPSKCLVRNPHLNLCPKFGGSFGGSSAAGSGGSLNFGVSASGSTTALIEPVYPIVEQADEKTSLDLEMRDGMEHAQHSNDELEITDVDDGNDVESGPQQAVIVAVAKPPVDETAKKKDESVEENADENVPMRLNLPHSTRCPDRRSAESDVADILADDDDDDEDGEEEEDDDEVTDDDAFKNFDSNLETILYDLQQEQNQLDYDLQVSAELLRLSEAERSRTTLTTTTTQGSSTTNRQQATLPSRQTEGFDCDDAPSTSMQALQLRQRLHSTDSETENNNGSRSPLLSGKQWELDSSATARAADKALRNEIAAVQRLKQLPHLQQQNHQHLYETPGEGCGKGEGDSGCPSSDCEQVSASSKDMLLSGMDATYSSAAPSHPAAAAQEDQQKQDQAAAAEEAKPATAGSNSGGKSLGAIPKVVKYREVEMPPTLNSACTQPYKRRGGNNNSNINHSILSGSKAASRTSSSNSSRSISADSFSADIQKMLWLMHGGPVDERGRPVTGIGTDGAPIAANPNIVPPNMSTAHFQFYQDALNALNTKSMEGLSLSERAYFRDQIRRSSKQISEPANNSSMADFVQGQELLCAGGGGASMMPTRTSHPAIGVVVSSTGARSGTTLSIQGLLNVIADERTHAQARVGISGGGGSGSATGGDVSVSLAASGITSAIGGGPSLGGGNSNAAATILNVDAHHIDNYCDYWRPACMLNAEKPTVPKSFYKYRFKCCGYEREYKITMDRLELLALFDRDLHWLHILLSVMLCALVSYLGATILQLGYYKDIFAFLFCAVIAGAQYSLVKSVQPDAASPIHGFNKIVAYSRAIYFSACAGFLLFLEQLRSDYDSAAARSPGDAPVQLVFYGIHFAPSELTAMLQHIMYVLLLCFPLIFSLGLFPQINTFLMYLLEQIDMHVFGGNATGSLLGAFLCVVRSILGISLLYGPLYAALAEDRGTQYIVFSIFCAMLIPLGYHLSRSASDLSNLWALVKSCIVSTYRDDEDELSAVASLSSQKPPASTPKSGSSKTHAQPLSSDREQVGNATSAEQIEMSSLEKLPNALDPEHSNLERKRSKSKASSVGSSSQTLAKTISSNRKGLTASNSCASMAAAVTEASAALEVDDVVASKPAEEVANTVAAKDPTADGSAVHEAIPGDSVDATVTLNSTVAAELDDVIDEEEDKVSTASTTHPGDMSTITAGGAAEVVDAGGVGAHSHNHDTDSESPDPLPKKLQSTVNTRLKNDLVVTALLAMIVLGLHSSTVFTVLQPDLNIVLYAFTGALGLLLHYIIPQMRKHQPWLCFARPLLRQKEYGQFEVSSAPKVMWFEQVYIYLCMVERNVLFPLLVVSATTADAQQIGNKYGYAWATLIVAVCALKFIRNAYSDSTNQYLIVMFTVLLFRADFAVATETFLIDYFFVSLAYRKCCDFLLKLQFIVTYIAPWQITWGSAFHAFAQPFSVPHSAMLFLQAGVSALLSTPLNPFLGSAIFLTSYVRPIKFWERDYNTRRIDHSNTRLSSQLERDLGADDNNLNSIFYEHLTRSLQHSLCGDLLMGRWGNVNQGDCFVLASDYLNCLVHIIELGNGLCTFQMRGLEFRGTYCQQREVEAITEDVEDNDGCCCCDPGHIPRILSANAMFSTRWLAWQVVAAQYVLEGYSISDNLASATLQVFEYRKVLITYYIKSIIYYVLKNPKLEQWLASTAIHDALQHTLSRQFVDLDPIFNYNLDEDFDFRAMGITRSSFCYVYLNWINFCVEKRKECQQPANATPLAQPAAAAAHNDSKSTPNLSGSNVPINSSGAATNVATATSITGVAAQAKSQSQQQLRTRPQKSATMSGSATVNANHSSEHIATSQSFANISRQTSESAPGLSGAGLSIGYAANAAHTTLDTSLNNSSMTVTGASATLKIPLTEWRKALTKPLRKEDPTTNNSTTQEVPQREKTNLPKLHVQLVAKDSPIVSLCLALGLLARRSLATASHSSLTGIEYFLHGLHALFKGDFRITPRDEWVFADMELLHAVVAPAVKMALKLQQDHISNPDEFHDPHALYEAIDTSSKDLVISHEADPVWRSAVLRGAPNLLALRHVMEDGSDEYRIIRLTKRFLSFRVIKLNRECVRGLWAGQQQELIYLRNRNPERGSIQNAKQALRNIINSSCDQPIGYPIYVSPLTTSYADTNEQLRQVIGGAITLESIKANVLRCWQRIRERCRQGCSSGSALAEHVNASGTVMLGCSTGGESGSLPPYNPPPVFGTLLLGAGTGAYGVRATNVSGLGGGNLNAPQYNADMAVGMRAASGAGMAMLPRKPRLLNREREMEREREMVIESLRGLTQLAEARERRATLPSTSASLCVAPGGNAHAAQSTSANADANQLLECTEAAASASHHCYTGSLLSNGSSPRYAKISCSSGNLGIGNIITTPGEYPRKSKGPICLTAAAAAAQSAADACRRPLIDLGTQVVIVNATEIYDCLDLGRRLDVVWPCEEMRAKGGRLSWKDWLPQAGMEGYVVHYWLPKHPDPRFRSHVKGVVYLVVIDEYYVPVGEYGLQEYSQIVHSSSTEEMEALTLHSRRNSLVFELDDLHGGHHHHHQHHHHHHHQQQREGLTPILGSSLESPTSQLAGATASLSSTLASMKQSAGGLNKSKIQAVSSSSSEDEASLQNIEMQRRAMLLNVWKFLSDKEESRVASPKPEVTTPNATPSALDSTFPQEALKAAEASQEPVEPSALALPQTPLSDTMEEVNSAALSRVAPVAQMEEMLEESSDTKVVAVAGRSFTPPPPYASCVEPGETADTPDVLVATEAAAAATATIIVTNIPNVNSSDV